ncbi:YihA family ribosome biogenesis GTP-binding protein [bacterium]|jgi:GTP-binding protein|nr:YihA family ribosome biogenesis GTP-binding protein [bacterium]MBT7310233.1 YihA family ribosome biogenesis GTP-binding protein [bacterium]
MAFLRQQVEAGVEVEVKFITSAPNLAGRPEEILPEIAFIGRSNCGKSSLINYYLDRRSMAKISGKPGKTRLLNYFEVEENYYLVDLPGYGFARVSKSTRHQWQKLIRQYFFAGDRPMAVFLLLDARHKPTEDDKKTLKWLQDAELPYSVVVTKIDKVSKNILIERYREIVTTLQLSKNTPFFPTSSTAKIGRENLLQWVDALLEE